MDKVNVALAMFNAQAVAGKSYVSIVLPRPFIKFLKGGLFSRKIKKAEFGFPHVDKCVRYSSKAFVRDDFLIGR